LVHAGVRPCLIAMMLLRFSQSSLNCRRPIGGMRQRTGRRL
jgi:hypothetical protein